MIKVKICLGTACYILGGAELISLKEHFTKEELKNISIEVETCIGICKNENAKPPYVFINNEIFENAELLMIVSEIKNLLNNKE
ncbi:MAG: hypothetical protein L3J74_12175 [Bacteroidales bacterium]|nr:hypothetical protein [Bacteroidales bacterium]